MKAKPRQPAEAITAVDLVDKFIESRERQGASDRYLRDCRSRLGKFSKAFRCQIASITASDISQWLDGMKGCVSSALA